MTSVHSSWACLSFGIRHENPRTTNSRLPGAHQSLHQTQGDSILLHEFRSHRQVGVQIKDPDIWRKIQQAGRDRYPGHPELGAPDKPIRRHHYSQFKRVYISHDKTFAERARAVHRPHAVAQANEIGLCREDGGGSLTHPSPDRTIPADGKVVKPRFGPRERDKDTGFLIPKRRDPDAAVHPTGTGEKVYGIAYVMAVTRGDAPNQRISLDVTHAPRVGGEALHAIDMYDELLPLAPGCQVVRYDGAFRGTHLNRLATVHGVQGIARLHNKHGDVVLDRDYGSPVTVYRPDGSTTEVELHLKDCSPHVRQLDENGDPHLTPLTRIKTSRSQRNDGTWRWYIDWELPSSIGGGTIRLRYDQTEEDNRTGFNRAEHLRPIPPDDPDHKRLYDRRVDCESGNKIIDDMLLRERAHSV